MTEQRKYHTAHTWAKINRREQDVSEWWNMHLKPNLDAGVLIPKRTMLYLDAQHPQLWYRIRHDYESVWIKSVTAMDARAAIAYARALYDRRNK
jgi:hypothetical protein